MLFPADFPKLQKIEKTIRAGFIAKTGCQANCFLQATAETVGKKKVNLHRVLEITHAGQPLAPRP